MKLLLDTHVLLWWLADDKQLSNAARSQIADPANEVRVSVVSAWEIEIKRSLGKLHAPTDLERALIESGFVELPLQLRHTKNMGLLPSFHADPFDRMLVAQAICESLVLVTHDTRIQKYPVSTLPA